MSRLDRLFRLAKKTGDTLIVHDPEGRDMVIVDVEQYEHLIDGHARGFDHDALYEMDEREMLDKINRDIAVWRSHQEDEDQFDRGLNMEEQLRNDPPFDPFEEDYMHNDAWHTAGDVLDRHRAELFSRDRHRHDDMFASLVDTAWDDEDDYVDEEDVEDDEELMDAPLFERSEKNVVSDADVFYDEIGEDAFAMPEEKKQVPYVSRDDVSFPLESDDEPIFFEEPV